MQEKEAARIDTEEEEKKIDAEEEGSFAELFEKSSQTAYGRFRQGTGSREKS